MIKKRIIITSGDLDGIGLEVSLKALLKLKPAKDCQLILMMGPSVAKKLVPLFSKLLKKYRPPVFASLTEAVAIKTKNPLLLVQSNESPADWVVSAGKVCLKDPKTALATAPLSKKLIYDSGYNALGHTELLKNLSRAKDVFMGFIGEHFHVLLATGHVAIRDVSANLTAKKLSSAVTAATRLRQLLPNKSRPIALVGLNPHAGEKSIIGAEESFVFKKVLASHKKSNVLGPLVPDVCYQKTEWAKYSVYVAPYHDQGLIPFKLVHGQDSGVHVTVGLPFIRTSVDHGTAKDIFGQNKANASSMYLAIQCAYQFLKEAKHGI